MKLLLGATVALLIGALAVSWQGMKQGVSHASPDELARLKGQIEELRKEQDQLQQEKRLLQLKAAAPAAAAPAPASAELEAVKSQLETLKQEQAAKDEADKAARDAKLAQDEEGLLSQRDLEKGDNELLRARQIADALLVGRVTEYVENAELGAFITFEVLMQEQVNLKPGDVIAVRRKTGILSQFKVSEVSPEGGIANPLPGFGPVQPKQGDELIIPPQY